MVRKTDKSIYLEALLLILLYLFTYFNASYHMHTISGYMLAYIILATHVNLCHLIIVQKLL